MKIPLGRPVGGDRPEPPTRPAAWRDLPWRPQAAVRWFSPLVLADAGLRVLLSAALGAYLDKRELQVAVPAVPLDLSAAGELWIDYLADTGDGFPATYSVARTAACRELHVPGLPQPLPRADLLVLGGDEVYPTAGPRAYEQRFLGPFAAALPWMPPDRQPIMLALPGNHDWYDGLTSFVRTFCQQKAVGGWRTMQTRSYFAAQLPHRWWLWGVDTQISSYIDEPQLRFFESLDVRDGDRVILCVAEPGWVDAPHDPEAYRNLAYLERKLVRPRGARVPLVLAGDLHHYSRYVGDDQTHKVTSGGGGAFTYPTHGLPATVRLTWDPDKPEDAVPHRLVERTPAGPWSRMRAFAAVGLGLRNPSFLAVPAVVSVLLLVGAIRQERARPVPAEVGDLALSLIASSATLTVLVVVTLALVAFAKPPKPVRRPLAWWSTKAAMGIIHAVAHLLALVGVAWISLRLSAPLAGWVGTLLALLGAAALGAVASATVVGLYLALANGAPPARWATHANEAYSSQRRTDGKHFVRLHLGPDGVLHLHAIGLDGVARRWRFTGEDADPDDPWLAPEEEIPVSLLDGPVRIGGDDA